MLNITLIFFAMTVLMAVLGFGPVPSSLSELARILFAAFGALAVISLALNLVSARDNKPSR